MFFYTRETYARFTKVFDIVTHRKLLLHLENAEIKIGIVRCMKKCREQQKLAKEKVLGSVGSLWINLGTNLFISIRDIFFFFIIKLNTGEAIKENYQRKKCMWISSGNKQVILRD